MRIFALAVANEHGEIYLGDFEPGTPVAILGGELDDIKELGNILYKETSVVESAELQRMLAAAWRAGAAYGQFRPGDQGIKNDNPFLRGEELEALNNETPTVDDVAKFLGKHWRDG